LFEELVLAPSVLEAACHGSYFAFCANLYNAIEFRYCERRLAAGGLFSARAKAAEAVSAMRQLMSLDWQLPTIVFTI
jgi:hypothetical protein